MQLHSNTNCKGCVLLLSEIPGDFNILFIGINCGIVLLDWASATACFCISKLVQWKKMCPLPGEDATQTL